MKHQVNDLCAEWEHKLDTFTDGSLTLKDFDPYKDMLSYTPEIKANPKNLIKEDFESRYQEALEVKRMERTSK